MIANLGMYDMPATSAANDALWTAIRANLGFGPAKLTRTDNLWSIWRDPELVFAQTCGFPYRSELQGKVQLVGTPDYGLEGCPPGYYNSVFVCRVDDPRPNLGDFAGATFAFNEPVSQSGWAAPVHHMGLADMRPGALHQSGGHALSARAVADGIADFAALDALTWTLLQTHDREVSSRLRVLETTAPTPTLPYITSLGQNADAIHAAVAQAIDDLDSTTSAALHLKGLVNIPAETYLAVPTPPTPEALMG